MPNFELVKEHEHSFEIRHPGGETFHIAKAGLDKTVHAKIKAMKPIKMADGGVVPDEDDSPSESIPINLDHPAIPESAVNPNAGAQALEAAPVSVAAPGAIAPDVVGVDPEEYAKAAMANSAPPQDRAPAKTAESEPAAEAKPSATPAYDPMADANKYFGQAAGAVQQSAKAQQDFANDSAAAIQQNQAQQADLQKQYAEKYAGIESDLDQDRQAIMQGKIDPNRLWHNAGTGSKIAASIGLILGGIGSGLTHQPNAALQVMQNAIDRDIDAQRADLNKQHTLYSMNLQRYQNAHQAELATRLQLNNALQAHLQIAATKAQGAQAQAGAQTALAGLGLQAAQLKREIAMMGVQNQVYGNTPTGQGGLPVGQEPPALLTDEKYRQNRVVINGRAYQSNSKEEGDAMRSTEAQAGPILDMVRQLDQLGPNAAVPGTAENQAAHALRARLSIAIPMFNGSIAGVKRINESEIKSAEDQLRDPTKFSQLLNGGVRNQIFFKNLENEMESARQAKLIGYKGMSQYKSFKPMGGGT